MSNGPEMPRHGAFDSIAHRPWPLPDRPWIWQQRWRDLCFAHFAMSPASVAPLLPAGLTPQTFDGAAWLGVVPFRIGGLVPRPLPGFLGFHSFPELNLRTYVEHSGKPGVWFLSLDATWLPLVIGGRTLFNLPYFLARMRMQAAPQGWIGYSSQRKTGDARFQGEYRAIGEPFLTQPGTFEHWATERYCLYSQKRNGALIRVEVHHGPWPLQRAELKISRCDLFAAAGLPEPTSAPICHYSTGVDVVSYPADLL